MPEPHRCDFHSRQQKFPYETYGPAILICEEDEKGEFWVSNGEYANQVNFCPFCGEGAPVQFPFDSLPFDPRHPNPFRAVTKMTGKGDIPTVD